MQLYYGGKQLKNEIVNTTNIKKIKIAVAYFSDYGLKTLQELISKNNLSKNRVEIYLSPEFTNKNQGEILKELNKIAKTYIVFDAKFHPKVYLFECENRNKLVFGSSNFTQNGIESNIEFDSILEITNTSAEKTKVNYFFDYCKNKAKTVDDEMIDWYISIELELEELRKVQDRIKKKIFQKERQDDPFDENDYNLDEYYFKYKDYELLFPRNMSKEDSSIKKSREDLREKILDIHNNIYKDIKRLGVNCHWRKDNISSLIRPCKYNKHSVDWMGVRYGKTEEEVKGLNIGASKDEELGFQKHACIQYAISPYGFDVNLFHSVPKEGIDRDYMHKKLMEYDFRQNVEKELHKLKGHGFTWNLDDEKFSIDSNDISEFCDFYLKNDCEGKFSSLSIFFAPNDDEIKDLDSICKVVKNYVRMLVPLYNLVSYRY